MWVSGAAAGSVPALASQCTGQKSGRRGGVVRGWVSAGWDGAGGFNRMGWVWRGVHPSTPQWVGGGRGRPLQLVAKQLGKGCRRRSSAWGLPPRGLRSSHPDVGAALGGGAWVRDVEGRHVAAGLPLQQAVVVGVVGVALLALARRVAVCARELAGLGVALRGSGGAGRREAGRGGCKRGRARRQNTAPVGKDAQQLVAAAAAAARRRSGQPAAGARWPAPGRQGRHPAAGPGGGA